MFTANQFLPDTRRGLRKRAGIIAVCGLAAGSLWGCNAPATNASSDKTPPPPTTAAASHRDIIGYAPLPGSLVSPPGTRADVMPSHLPRAGR